MRAFILVLASVALTSIFVEGCIEPKGIGSRAGDIDPKSLDVPFDGIWRSNKEVWEGELARFIGPVKFQLIQMATIPIYGSMAAYEDKALDHFARKAQSDARRRCTQGTSADLLDLHRRVTLAYAMYFSYIAFVPRSEPAMTAILTSYGLSPDICQSKDCGDVSTPWGLAYTLTREAKEFSRFDGWNSDGSLSRQYNRLPYQDFLEPPYRPVNSPYALTRKDRFQPILWGDEFGFQFHQEHVVPHIGQTAKSIFLGNDDICAREADDPRYDFAYESKLALQRMAALSDEEKMKIEFFENKLISLVPLADQYFERSGHSLDSWEHISADALVINTLYEATVVAWKEKLRYDSVRPVSYIRSEWAHKVITTYAGHTPAGATQGTQSFLGKDFESYIPTQAHGEYPSGSSCQCHAFRVAMTLLTGRDDVTQELGNALVIEHKAFSSKVEPLSTPARDLSLEYDSWSVIAADCGQSRLDGGMHYTAAIEGSNRLCASIGEKTYAAFERILSGEQPAYVVDANDRSCTYDRCPNKKTKRKGPKQPWNDENWDLHVL